MGMFLVPGLRAYPPYTTGFPLTENPISEGKIWLNGLADGLDWTNVRTSPALAYGTGGSVQYDDSIGIMKGVWKANQYVRAVVHLPVAYVYGEVELLLRFSISAHSATGYEANFRTIKDGTSYCSFVRWNGPITNFTILQEYTSNAAYGVQEGDILEGQVTGNDFLIKKNGITMLSYTDATYTSGNPGLGFYNDAAAGGTPAHNSEYGYSSFQASEL